MTLEAAKRLIEQERVGYSVHFEWIVRGGLLSDLFPDTSAGEQPIKTINEAWELAGKFAAATRGDTCNLYVIDAYTFKPVSRDSIANQ